MADDRRDGRFPQDAGPRSPADANPEVRGETPRAGTMREGAGTMREGGTRPVTDPATGDVRPAAATTSSAGSTSAGFTSADAHTVRPTASSARFAAGTTGTTTAGTTATGTTTGATATGTSTYGAGPAAATARPETAARSYDETHYDPKSATVHDRPADPTVAGSGTWQRMKGWQVAALSVIVVLLVLWAIF